MAPVKKAHADARASAVLPRRAQPAVRQRARPTVMRAFAIPKLRVSTPPGGHHPTAHRSRLKGERCPVHTPTATTRPPAICTKPDILK